MTSIRQRLIVIILATLFLSISAITVFTFHYLEEEFTEVMDGSLKQLAISISSKASFTDIKSPILTQQLEEEGEFIIQIWHSGELTYHSHPLIAIQLQANQGFGNVSYDYGTLRYYQLIHGEKSVQVLQSLDARKDMFSDMQQRFILPILFACPIFIILTYVAIGRGLAPLSSLSKRLEERNASNLNPIDIKDVPEEIIPLVQSLNQLLQRLKESVTLQRRFTSDAAHELRTPLTAIKLQLDMLERADNEHERKETESSLRAGIDRSISLVENLLLLARHESEALSVGIEKVNLCALTRKVVADLDALSSSKHQNLTVTCDETDSFINAQSSNMYVVIENLTQNAILYTPEHGKVHLSVSDAGESVSLTVSDNGIGIKPEDRQRVFDRFYRCQGTKQMGSGLGLAIVKNIVEYYHGSIKVGDGLEGQGTTFTLTFPKSVL